jgi:hypothetical protein
VDWLPAAPQDLNPKGSTGPSLCGWRARRPSPGATRARSGAPAGQGRGGKLLAQPASRVKRVTPLRPLAPEPPPALPVPPPCTALGPELEPGPEPGGQDRLRLTWAALAAMLARGEAQAAGSPAQPGAPARPRPAPHSPNALPRRPHPERGAAASAAAQPGRGAQGTPRRCCCRRRRRRRCCIPGRVRPPLLLLLHLSPPPARRRQLGPRPARRPRQSPASRPARRS